MELAQLEGDADADGSDTDYESGIGDIVHSASAKLVPLSQGGDQADAGKFQAVFHQHERTGHVSQTNIASSYSGVLDTLQGRNPRRGRARLPKTVPEAEPCHSCREIRGRGRRRRIGMQRGLPEPAGADPASGHVEAGSERPAVDGRSCGRIKA